MPLIPSVPNARITQGFGPSSLSVEPAMWAAGDVAAWSFFTGASFFEDFHPGIDRSAVEGTPMRAMQTGTVAFAGWKDSISGYQVEVAINDGASWSVNHLSKILCRVGQPIAQGAIFGLVGHTGATTGSHTHEGLEIDTDVQGVARQLFWDAGLFMAGGNRANDPRIQPDPRMVVLNGPGINIRKADKFLFDRASVYAVSKADGIYRLGTGKRIAPLNKAFPVLRRRNTAQGDYLVVAGFGQRLAIRRSLVHFV